MSAKGLLPLFVSLLISGQAIAKHDRSLQYRITPLQLNTPTQEADLFRFIDLNEKGEILLRAGNPAHTLVWRRGQLIDLTERLNPEMVTVEPQGFNDRGVIVGNIEFEGFIFFKNHRRLIDVSEGGVRHPTSGLTPRDINNRGQILGVTDFLDNPGEDWFLLTGKKVTVLEPLPLPNDTDVFARALNDKGVVVGASVGSAGSHAAIWQDGTVMELSMPVSPSMSTAQDINNHNDVVGVVQAGNLHGAFLWSDGIPTLLPSTSPAFPLVVAVSINDCGDIVGTTGKIPSTESVATLWRDGIALDVNSLIRETDPLKSFVKFTVGIAINDAGQIIAFGVDSRIAPGRFLFAPPYLLTPVDGKGHHARDYRRRCRR
jgi:hypothetical protein